MVAEPDSVLIPAASLPELGKPLFHAHQLTDRRSPKHSLPTGNSDINEMPPREHDDHYIPDDYNMESPRLRRNRKNLWVCDWGG